MIENRCQKFAKSVKNSALDKFGTFLTMRENYDEKFNQIC